MHDHLFSEKFACPFDNLAIPEIEPRSFSFNSPQGACPTCTGLGTELKIDPELVLNPTLSVSEGGILPWNRLATTETWFSRLLAQVAKAKNISLTTPIGELPESALHVLIYGSSQEQFTVEGENRQGRATSIVETFEGVIPNLMRRYRETDSEYIRSEIEKYMRQEQCPDCQGKRLKQEALSVTIDGRSIWDVNDQSIRKARDWIVSLSTKNLSAREATIAKSIVKEIASRLDFLIDVGLDYLTLTRKAGTLAGGESQRIRLASQIGSGLSGVLYVLDEPSIGLHQRDNSKLINTLKKLRELGNTVIVVEHDDETMEESDYIFDFGPAAGEHGGQVIAHGTPEQIIKNTKSITGAYLSGRKRVEVDATIIEKYDTQNPEIVNSARGLRKKVNKDRV